jgi:protein kinase-like protein/WD40 repeat protein
VELTTPDVVGGEPSLVGVQFGSYRITGFLGAGGMGEVYHAHDAKLGRDVAIKVLPRIFIADRERLARFEREARLLAVLNHPHIGAIYGLEEAEGRSALILELVEGPTLADRIADGRLPLREAVEIASADCRRARSRARTRHRPPRSQAGQHQAARHVDAVGEHHHTIGSAGARRPECQGARLRSCIVELIRVAPDGSHASPNRICRPYTRGHDSRAAAYMSPEQTRGYPVDKRTDIWSFGCVLYEALSGRRVFHAATIADIVAAVMTTEPDWTALPNGTPSRMIELLKRCLAKDLRNRLRDIGDARLDLDAADAATSIAHGLEAGHQRRSWTWPILGTVAVAGATFGVLALRQPTSSARPLMQFAIPLRPEHGFPERDIFPMVAIEPDGSRLAYVGMDGPTTRIFVRSLNQLDFSGLPDTEGAQDPVFSPDGSWIAFFVGSKLRKVPVGGGVPVTISDFCGSNPSGLTWNADDTLVWQQNFNDGLLRDDATMRMERTGPAALLVLRRWEAARLHRVRCGDRPRLWVVGLEGDQRARPFARTPFQERYPVFSPDGGWIAYESNESGDTQVYIARYPDGREKKRVSIEGGSEPLWGSSPIPSGELTGGHELFYRYGDQFMAVEIRTSPLLKVGRPRALFEGPFRRARNSEWSFAPLPDGQHFVVVKADSQEPVREIRLLLNWFDDLKQRVPIR